MKLIKDTFKGTFSALSKQLSYNEIIEFLDANWSDMPEAKQSERITQLDQALQSPSKKIHTIFFTGTNGKSLTMYFATKLLQEEGVTVGSFSAPHILTYNERLSINGVTISNKDFTELANEVLNVASSKKLQPSSFELLSLIALLYFANNNVNVALLEVTEPYAKLFTICYPKIAAITRVVPEKPDDTQREIDKTLEIIQPNTYVISADQSKLNLQLMLSITKEKGGKWIMPIRKLAPLNYPFEQLYGRCAALAERVTHLYVNKIAQKDAIIVTESLLTKPKARRGRPTLEAQRTSEINPQKTLQQFWKEDHGTLPARFQILDKEKPTVMLDTADNVDAFKNLLLGIRLLHYQRPLKGLSIVLGLNSVEINMEELLKHLRYFFKKTSGQVFVCPTNAKPGQPGNKACDVQEVTHQLKSMKIKAVITQDFKTAFKQACDAVDNRHGLIVVTGSTSIITDYWREHKGIKKL